MLVGLGVPALKVSLRRADQPPFLRETRDLRGPLLVSTGMGTRRRGRRRRRGLRRPAGTVLFHCVSAYPAPVEQCNLRVIPRCRPPTGYPWAGPTTRPGSPVPSAPWRSARRCSRSTSPATAASPAPTTLPPSSRTPSRTTSRRLPRPRRRAGRRRQAAHTVGGGERGSWSAASGTRRSHLAGRHRARPCTDLRCCVPRAASAPPSTLHGRVRLPPSRPARPCPDARARERPRRRAGPHAHVAAFVGTRADLGPLGPVLRRSPTHRTSTLAC